MVVVVFGPFLIIATETTIVATPLAESTPPQNSQRAKFWRNVCKRLAKNAVPDLFSRILPPSWPPLFLPFSQDLFALFSPSKTALFCRAKCTLQSLERGRFRMDLSTKFGKEIPSQNLREKCRALMPGGALMGRLSGNNPCWGVPGNAIDRQEIAEWAERE